MQGGKVEEGSLDLDAEKGGSSTARERLGNYPGKAYDLLYLHDSVSSQKCICCGVVIPGTTIPFPGFAPLLLMHFHKKC